MAISSKILLPVRAIFNILFAGRGYTKFCNLGMRVFPGLQGYTSDGSRKLYFRFFDQHWSSMSRLKDFEPEVMSFIDRFQEGRHLFFDVGANIGYWPVALADKKNIEVVCVEPASDSFRFLEYNVQRNQLDATLINAAVDPESGRSVELYGDKPLSRSLIPQNTSVVSQTVTTISLDGLFEQYYSPKDFDTLIVKLDIEGIELDVIKSFKALDRKSNIFVMYEDHGKDRTHKTTKYFIDNDSYEVMFIDRQNLRADYIENLSEVENIKTDSSYGYMFIAGKIGSLRAFVVG